eukprot:scaffold12_cov128-Skeletonema_dohrnii-CCMP3373.AAC.10
MIDARREVELDGAPLVAPKPKDSQTPPECLNHSKMHRTHRTSTAATGNFKVWYNMPSIFEHSPPMQSIDAKQIRVREGKVSMGCSIVSSEEL